MRSIVSLGMLIALAGTLAALSPTALAADGKSAVESAQCQSAKRKVAKEEKWETKGEAVIERDRKARATCATDPVCARYDARIKSMESRKAHHDARLARFKADAARACRLS